MIDLNRMREMDVQELIIRVSQYGPDLKTPTSYQAIAKLRTQAAGPWGVGIRSNPAAAAAAALDEAALRIRDSFRAARPEITAAAPSKYGF